MHEGDRCLYIKNEHAQSLIQLERPFFCIPSLYPEISYKIDLHCQNGNILQDLKGNNPCLSFSQNV